jgi:serine/threonine protein phosphatase 1
MLFNRIEVNHPDSRVFVVGDIHGRFDLLEKELDKLGFDEEMDFLFSVGDLVDRGPYSNQAVDYVFKPWFHAIRGNHEEMCAPDSGGTHWHISNGGKWFADMLDADENKARDFAAVLRDLPLALEVQLADGRLMGLVHAEYPCLTRKDEMYLTDWAEVQELVKLHGEKENQEYNPFLWNRDQVYRAMKLKKLLDANPEYVSERKLREFNPKNVDLMFFGHTPLKEPFTLGKCTWLDTGAFATDILTVKEVK